MSYLGELRSKIRPLAAACVGGGASLPLLAYTNGVFAPHLVEQFHWSRSQYALVGMTPLATLAVLPIIGRFTDRIGVRPVALVGTCLLPLCFIAYSQMQGNFYHFLAIFTLMLIIGSMTSPMVYTRLIAENFVKAQGLALTMVNCTPAVLAIVIVPVLNRSIEIYGWRASYLGVGSFVLVLGVIGILLTPMPEPRALEKTPVDTADIREEFGAILRSKVFWLIMAGMFLCLMQQPLHASQMNIMLQSKGLTSQTGAQVVTVYAFGTIVGRIACGLALDRFSTRVVTAISVGLPALGYLILGTNLDGVGIIGAAMFVVGLSVGAESDLMSFLVARYFNLSIFNKTLSLLYFCAFTASAVGALLISLTLQLSNSFSAFLYLVAGTVSGGALLFMLLPKTRDSAKVGEESLILKAAE